MGCLLPSLKSDSTMHVALNHLYCSFDISLCSNAATRQEASLVCAPGALDLQIFKWTARYRMHTLSAFRSLPPPNATPLQYAQAWSLREHACPYYPGVAFGAKSTLTMHISRWCRDHASGLWGLRQQFIKNSLCCTLLSERSEVESESESQSYAY